MCRPCGIIARRPVAGLVCGLCGAGEDNRHALLRYGEGAYAYFTCVYKILSVNKHDECAIYMVYSGTRSWIKRGTSIICEGL